MPFFARPFHRLRNLFAPRAPEHATALAEISELVHAVLNETRAAAAHLHRKIDDTAVRFERMEKAWSRWEELVTRSATLEILVTEVRKTADHLHAKIDDIAARFDATYDARADQERRFHARAGVLETMLREIGTLGNHLHQKIDEIAARFDATYDAHARIEQYFELRTQALEAILREVGTTANQLHVKIDDTAVRFDSTVRSQIYWGRLLNARTRAIGAALDEYLAKQGPTISRAELTAEIDRLDGYVTYHADSITHRLTEEWLRAERSLMTDKRSSFDAGNGSSPSSRAAE